MNFIVNIGFIECGADVCNVYVSYMKRNSSSLSVIALVQMVIITYCRREAIA